MLACNSWSDNERDKSLGVRHVILVRLAQRGKKRSLLHRDADAIKDGVGKKQDGDADPVAKGDAHTSNHGERGGVRRVKA